MAQPAYDIMNLNLQLTLLPEETQAPHKVKELRARGSGVVHIPSRLQKKILPGRISLSSPWSVVHIPSSETEE